MAAKEKIKGSVLKAVKISQLISANNLIGSRLEKNSEQSQIYHQTVVPKIDEFKQEFSGRGPQRVLEDLLRNYVLNKGIDENYETQGFAYFGRILHSHCWAAITRKDPSIPLMKTTVYPQLYILVNKDGIRFGFDYGFNVEPDSIFVTRVKSNPEMGNQILRLVSNPINLLPCSGLEAKDGPDPGKALEISGLDDVNQKWSNRVSLIRNFSENDIPDDIETKVTETFDVLFDFFDTLSNVTHPRLSKGEVATVEQLSERTYLPIGFFKNLESLLIEKGQIILYGPPELEKHSWQKSLPYILLETKNESRGFNSIQHTAMRILWRVLSQN